MPKTLIPPPADDISKAPIENVLELTSLAIIDKDLFTNTRPLWHPPGARGIYGGAAIAQSLAAAQLTVPAPARSNNFARFYPHSMHCYFVLAGNADIPVIYSVERVREGKSFLTRTVQARQEGRCIFTTTISFSREGSAGKLKVEHEAMLPEGVAEELDGILSGEGQLSETEREERRKEGEAAGPFEHRRIALTNGESDISEREPAEKRMRESVLREGPRLGSRVEDSDEPIESAYIRRDWGDYGIEIPLYGPESVRVGDWTYDPPGNPDDVHSGLTAGALFSKFWRRDPVETAPAQALTVGAAHSKRPETKRTHQWVKARGTISPSAGHDAHLSALAYMSDSWFIGTVARVQHLWRFSSPRTSATPKKLQPPVRKASDKIKDSETPAHANEAAKMEDIENQGSRGPPRKIGMMVSLDHSIYFHKPASIRADEWLFQEMESPWAGDGRGLVVQRLWNREGELLATCIQEGVVRLNQEEPKGKL